MTSNDIHGPREVKLNPILILGSVYSKKLIQFFVISEQLLENNLLQKSH